MVVSATVIFSEVMKGYSRISCVIRWYRRDCYSSDRVPTCLYLFVIKNKDLCYASFTQIYVMRGLFLRNV